MLPALALAFLALLFCLWVWLHWGNLPICVWLLLACAFRRWWIGDWDGDGWWHEKEMVLSRERTANGIFFFFSDAWTTACVYVFSDRGKHCHLFSSRGGNAIKLFRFVQGESMVASEEGRRFGLSCFWRHEWRINFAIGVSGLVELTATRRGGCAEVSPVTLSYWYSNCWQGGEHILKEQQRVHCLSAKQTLWWKVTGWRRATSP